MKRIILLVLFVTTTLYANAQLKIGDVLVCTRNEVNVRTGPGNNYPIGEEDHDSKANPLNDSDISKIIKKYDIKTEDMYYYKLKKATQTDNYCQLNKPEIMNNGDDHVTIYYLGKTQNGYLYISVIRWDFFGWGSVYKGWAPAQYLKVACKKCDGFGVIYSDDSYSSKQCPQCHGRGY